MVLFDKNLPIEFIFNREYKNLSLLIIHVYITISTSEASLLEPLRELIRRPEILAQSYIPTMPEDEDYEAFQAILEKDQVKLYECPNGHLYTVGECFKPMQQSKCPTCDSRIGGLNHIEEAGNKMVQNLVDKTNIGFCLPDVNNRPIKAEGIRSMSPLETTILRLLVNCCYYINSILMLKNSAKLYHEHIIHDAKVLSNCLQHSIDESILLVHHVLSRITSINGFTVVDLKLNSKKTRRVYEEEFCVKYLRALIGNNSEAIIQDIHGKLKNDNKDSDIIHRIAYEQLKPNIDETDNVNFKCLNDENSWLYRVHISVDHMVNIIYSNHKNDSKLVLLNGFIKQMHKLESIKYLPAIVQMVYLLYRVFYRQIDRKKSEEMKIKDLLNSNIILLSEESKKIITDGCTAFMSAWKNFKYFINLKKHSNFVDKLKLDDPKSKIEERKVEDIPLSYLLPNFSENGRYIYALIVDLTDLQNEFLRFYINRKTEKFVKLNSSTENPDSTKLTLKKIELNEVKPTNCIKFTIDIDILRIVHMHCNYSLGSSKALNIEYNFEKIQSSIEERILNDKSWINNKVNFLINLHFVNYK